MYLRALKDIELFSEVMIEDSDNGDQSIELLLTEAMYSIACCSRAVRQIKPGQGIQAKVIDLKNCLNEGFQLMSGDGIKRLNMYLSDYFSVTRIESRVNSLKNRFETAFNSKKLYELIEDEEVEDQVFDYFLFIDRYACFNNPEDCPVGGLEDTLAKGRNSVDYVCTRLKAIFNIYSKSIVTYRLNTFIPDDSVYSFWFEFQEVPVEDFVYAFEKKLFETAPERMVFKALLQTLPEIISSKIKKTGIEKNLKSLTGILGDQAQEVFGLIAAVVQSPELAVEKSWSKDGDEIELIRAHHAEDLQKEASRLQKEFDGVEKRDVLILEYLLAGDEDKLEDLLKEL